MILSDNDIIEHIKSGDIVIEPFDKSNLKPASYTLRLNNKIFIPKAKAIDCRQPQVEYEEITMNEGGYTLQPNEFILGQTLEQISISQNLAGLLDTRTSLARIGLTMLQGSILIEPGQSASHETLEIKNISQNPIVIYPGMKAVKILFLKLLNESLQNYSEIGTYAKQTRPNPKEKP